MMNRQEFDDALNRFGGNLERWPDDLRIAAEQLVVIDPKAASELAGLRQMEGTISASLSPQPVDAALLGRLTSRIKGRGATEITLRPTGRLAAWAGAATLTALMIGFVAGVVAPQDLGEDSFAGLMFGGSSFEDSSESIL
jgi:hypothetical protein